MADFPKQTIMHVSQQLGIFVRSELQRDNGQYKSTSQTNSFMIDLISLVCVLIADALLLGKGLLSSCSHSVLIPITNNDPFPSFRDALNKMKDVYQKTPQMGDPNILEPKMSETLGNIEKLRLEIQKYEVSRGQNMGQQCIISPSS